MLVQLRSNSTCDECFYSTASIIPRQGRPLAQHQMNPPLVPEAIQPSSIVIINIITIISTITRSTIRFSSKVVLAGTVPMYTHTRHPIFANTTEKAPFRRLYK